ncbi:SpvB/TcaC N-terminal domain-containing protein [Caulobacter sp.]|uniref:SpvB/TcaC N-terminal domain-containing protein n=1 Tax=Caulobacter sp. TaxID=78 RepID=UPI001AFD00CE|nr:SpvB/TcaC N-terminal domain-containing protein [Caulobacter sp.]MBO9545435.1 hypothetical protein [Caulobacter sp.]
MRAPSEIQVPKIDVKEGAKISGQGDRFDVNMVTGAASLSLPVDAPSLRGVAPELSLTYGGSVGNSPYGLGFDLALPAIARLTDRGVPTYTDADRFLIDGDELTPAYASKAGAWIKDERTEGDYTVVRYRPRIETTSNRIEWWRHRDGGSYWKSVSAENTTTLYGDDPDARICDPAEPTRIYKWLATQTLDAHGNRIVYRYRREDGTGLPADANTAQIYIDAIGYGSWRDGQTERLAVEIRFDYGQYDLPGLDPVRPWPQRLDPFTTFRPGFELKTWRLCRNILTVHDLPDAPGGRALTKVLALDHDETPLFSTLRTAQQIGWRTEKDGSLVSQAKPALSLGFNAFDVSGAQWRALEVSGLPPFQGPPGRGHYQFVDLNGDGIAGMLFNDASRLVYWRALGDGRYQPPVTPLRAPIDRDLARGRCALMDLDGDGQLELVVRDRRRAGYYRRADETWESFVPFAGTPPEIGAPSAELADLDGDGRQDLMTVAAPDRLRVYRSQGTLGYGPPQTRRLPRDFPSERQQDPAILVAFANIFGDGLEHRVRVASGAVTVWPSLGHGRFGPARRLDNAPLFAADLDASRIFFADTTGSGYADLILASPDSLAIHRNLGGEGFAAAEIIPVPHGVSDLDIINFADVFGSGLAAFVLGKAGPQIVQYALDFPGAGATYRLAHIDDGFGGSTTLSYRSSTAFQLEARRAQRPWATPLASVFQLVSEVVRRDANTGLTTAARYDYADGYYDTVEREFRGFGYVRCLERPSFTAGGELFAEPSLSEHWNNVGAAVATERRSAPLPDFRGQPLVPDNVLDPAAYAAGGQTLRGAYRAVKDREAAKRKSGADAAGQARAVAYQTSAQNYLVTLLQPQIDGHMAAFRVAQRQSRALAQEDNADQARIADSYVLNQDEFGNPTLLAEIAYPRGSDPSLPPQQTVLIATATERAYINHPATAAEPYHYIGQQWQERKLQVGGLPTPADLFDFARVEQLYGQALGAVIAFGAPFTAGQIQARLFDWTRDLYWNAAQDAPLGFGAIAAPGLLYEQQRAVFPPSFVTEVFGDRVDTAHLGPEGGEGAGYVLADGYWWTPGVRRVYAGAEQYFVPVAIIDPYGAQTQYAYDRYALEMVSSTDALGQVTRFAIDYQALRPWQVTDPNDNITQAVYGPLSTMLAVSVFGEMDGRTVGDAPLDGYDYIAPRDKAEVLADPERFLQGAGSFYWEDYFAPARGEGPVNSVFVEADRAINPAFPVWDPGPRRYGAVLAYVDASARPLARQTKVEGAALEPSRPNDAWLVTDQVAYDSQGRVAKRYNAYASSLPVLDLEPAAPCTLSQYDAVGRVIATVLPPGFSTRTRYHTWGRDVWDADQTVVQSPYYQGHINDLDPSFAGERDALLKAAQFDGAYTSFDLDPLGRDSVETRREIFAPLGVTPPPPELRPNGTWRDIAGAVTRQADPRFYQGAATSLFNIDTVYDMLGKPVLERSTDRGQTAPGVERRLFDGLGGLIDRWDNAGARLSHLFDTLRRPTGLRVHPIAGAPYRAESLVYGTDPAQNTRNRVVIRRDQAQETKIATYDLAGQLVAESRDFVVDDSTPVDWSDPATVALRPEVWLLGRCYNRRGWLLATINADGTVSASSFYVNGWLASVGLAPAQDQPAVPELVERRYTPSGNVAFNDYASGVSQTRLYDPNTDRLTTLTTTRASDGARLQDDRYWYDPVGNVTRIAHAAEAQRIWNGGLAPPDNDYTYDSLYQLRVATGRQQAGMTAAGALAPPAADPSQSVAFIERYTVDPSGNLTEISHTANASGGQGSWTNRFAVSATSNHAVPADWVQGGKTPDDYYDANGNLATLSNLPRILFDYRDQIRAATLVARPGADDDVEFYAYGGDRQRRRKTKRFLQGPGVTVVEETFYIDALIVTRRSRITATGTTLDAEGRSLSVLAKDERILIIDQDSQEPTPQRRYQLSNNQTSITLETDETGQMVTYEEYFPYGGQAYAKGRTQLDLDTKRFRFVGRELDRATGLYCIGLRYYLAGMGRWLSPDPAGVKDGLNLYAYARCNPTTFVDKSGLQRTRLTGTTAQVQQQQARMNGDFDRAREMVDDAIQLLESQITSRNGWLNSTLWSRGTIQQPDQMIQDWFGIRGTSRTDANNLFEVLDNFRQIQRYFARPPVQTRLSWRYAQSFFIHIPQFNIVTDTPASQGTIAYVYASSISWPDWRILPPSVRSRPMGPLTGVGLLSPVINQIINMTSGEGINLYETAHFGDVDGNERASTLVHEASHMMALTDDHAYGKVDSQALSTTRMMYNADSYGLFARAVYQANHP